MKIPILKNVFFEFVQDLRAGPLEMGTLVSSLSLDH